jgi:hypothetical protein
MRERGGRETDQMVTKPKSSRDARHYVLLIKPGSFAFQADGPFKVRPRPFPSATARKARPRQAPRRS